MASTVVAQPYLTISDVYKALDVELAVEGGGLRAICESAIRLGNVNELHLSKTPNEERIDVSMTITEDKGINKRKRKKNKKKKK